MKRRISLWWSLLRLSWTVQRPLTSATLAVITLSVAATPVSAVALRDAVDSMLDGNRAGALWAVLVSAAAYAALYVLQDATATLRNAVTNRIARTEIEPMVHDAVAELPGLEHLERTEVLDRVKVVRDGAGQMVGSTWRVVLIVSIVLRVGIAVALLGSVSPLLVPLLALAVLPALCQQRGQVLIKKAQLASAEDARLAQVLADLAIDPVAAVELRVSGAGAAVVGRQVVSFDAATRTRARAQFAAAAIRLAGWSVFLAGFIGGVTLVAESAITGHGSIGDLVLVVTIAVTLHQTVQVAVNSTTATSGASVVIENYLWLREQVAAVRADSAACRPSPQALAEGIRLQNVGFSYPVATRPALTDLTATLPAGQIVAIVGDYGSGKSTLVKLLAKLYVPSSGVITVDGVDLAELDTIDLRSRISAAFQDFGRFSLTIGDSIGIGSLDQIDDPDRIMQALDAADGTELLARLPSGLDTQLGRELGGVELSEGQWQRVALARASMRSSHVLLLLLDEPTASLDARAERDIFERYMARARETGAQTGAVTVIVSHRYSTVSSADLILVLDDGRLAEIGSHAELLAKQGLYAARYQQQAQAYFDHRVN